MSTRGRAIVIILSTLLLGVAIGALIVGPLVARHHFRRMADWRTPKGFAARLEEVIGPEPEQAEALREILTRYGEALHGVASRHRSEMGGLLDSLRAELDPLLTEEQKQRLERHRPPRGGHKPRHDPHDHPE
jgi:hypothetical protein